MKKIGSLTFAAALLVAACNDAAVPTTSTAALSTSSSDRTVDSTLPPVVDCPGAGDFSEGGGIANAEEDASDATSLGQLSWDATDQCETFQLEFVTNEGAPATTVPTVRVDHLESFQVLRVRLDIQGTVITDQLVETPLVDRLYVVRALDGGMFVDLHLNEPAAARVRIQSSPARLSIDLRPGLVDFVGGAAIDELVVVVSPSEGQAIDPFTQIMGYARTFEANVQFIATQSDAVVARANTTAADYLETWGEFRGEILLPQGELSLFIGDESPEDGSLQGVTIALDVGGG